MADDERIAPVAAEGGCRCDARRVAAAVGVAPREAYSSGGGDCGRGGGPVDIFLTAVGGGGIEGGGGRFIRGGLDLSGVDSVGDGKPSIAGAGESPRMDGKPSVPESLPPKVLMDVR